MYVQLAIGKDRAVGGEGCEVTSISAYNNNAGMVYHDTVARERGSSFFILTL